MTRSAIAQLGERGLARHTHAARTALWSFPLTIERRESSADPPAGGEARGFRREPPRGDGGRTAERQRRVDADARRCTPMHAGGLCSPLPLSASICVDRRLPLAFEPSLRRYFLSSEGRPAPPRARGPRHADDRRWCERVGRRPVAGRCCEEGKGERPKRRFHRCQGRRNPPGGPAVAVGGVFG